MHLKLGSTLKFIEQQRQFVIDYPASANKGQSKPIYILVPRSETLLLKRFINEMRPILLGNTPDHGYLWICDNGGRPRKEITYLVRQVQQMHLCGKSVGTHGFRHSQASAVAADAKFTPQEAKALAEGRGHTEGTSKAFYEHSLGKRKQAELAEQALEKLRATKRQKHTREEKDQKENDAHESDDNDIVVKKEDPDIVVKVEDTAAEKGKESPMVPAKLGRTKRLAIVVD